MKCTVCGAAIEADARFCTACGAAVSAVEDAADIEEALPTENVANAENIENIAEPEKVFEKPESVAPQKDRGIGFGIAAMSLGVLSVTAGLLDSCLFCGAVCGIVGNALFILISVLALLFGVIGLIMSKRSGAKNPMAVAGIVLGVVGTALLALVLIASIVSCVLSLVPDSSELMY